jgi:hypothetical protein
MFQQEVTTTFIFLHAFLSFFFRDQSYSTRHCRHSAEYFFYCNKLLIVSQRLNADISYFLRPGI